MPNKERQAETKVDSEQMPIASSSSPNAAKPNVGCSFILHLSIVYFMGFVGLVVFKMLGNKNLVLSAFMLSVIFYFVATIQLKDIKGKQKQKQHRKNN